MNRPLSNNESVPMTRRRFDLPRKTALRDSKIAMRIAVAWDNENDSEKAFKLFINNKDKLSTQRYWELLRSIWIIAGTLSNVGIFKKLMRSSKKNRYCFSTPEESEILRQMPEELKVYRACNDENDGGISWTYSEEYAYQYQKMYSKNMVLVKTVKKEDVFALINRNREFEIIILPEE